MAAPMTTFVPAGLKIIDPLHILVFFLSPVGI